MKYAHVVSPCPWSICLFVAPHTSRGSWLLEQHPAESQPLMAGPPPLSQGQHENVFI